MDEAIALSQAHRAYLIAPAGCGKTHLIAKAVAKNAKGRELILTHTHAGVDALRRRLKSMNVSSSSYHIGTIAGWSLRYAASYPFTSELKNKTPKGDDWDEVCSAAIRSLKKPFIQDIVRNSYTGVYVDEYQDCTVQQHALIMGLADLLPCRILGDPLQGIFGFGHNTLVDWDIDVAENFDRLPDLTIPWRWKGKNEDLGAWLIEVRNNLLSGQSIDLRNSPICFVQSTPAKSDSIQLETCQNTCRSQGSTVAIQPIGNQCHYIARRLPWLLDCVEPIDCQELFVFADRIQNSAGIPRVEAVLDFASCCMTQINAEFKNKMLKACTHSKMPSGTEFKKQASLLMTVESELSIAPVLSALKTLSEFTVTKVVKDKQRTYRAHIYRRELFNEMCRALIEFETGNYPNLHEAAWRVREITRHQGRRPDFRSTATTLLIKGLEFDHAILLNPKGMDAKNLYVALTRGCRSLTVISETATLAINK